MIRSRKWKTRLAAFFCVCAVGFLVAAGAVAQDDAASGAGSADPTGQVTQPGTLDEAHFRDADLRGVLQLLGAQSKKNIIPAPGVKGKFSGDFYKVTFKEALNAVMKATGFVYEEQGNFIYVYTPKQMEEILKSRRKMSVRVFRLAYAQATEVRDLVKPVLSKDGTVSVSPKAAEGISESNTSTGGMSYATEDVLIVRDYEDVMDKVVRIVADLDVRPQQVLIEATVLRATLSEENALGIDITSLDGINLSCINTEFSLSTSSFAGGVPSGGLSLSISSDRANLLVRALESVTDINVLANPKLLVVNKQRGQILIGNRDGYLTTQQSENLLTQSVEFLETGTKLVVRPYIGKDGYIRMEIHPKDSSGQVEQVGTNALPKETTTEVTSNVIVRDGHTIVIGGLFRERVTTGRAQVPVVGNLPYVGSLFRRTADAVKREEVIILVTPHIIKQAPDAAVSEQLRDDIERFRIGARKGLRWWGRSRLAQAHMRCAKKALRNDDRNMALWNLDLALALQPQMIDAIRMKERLTGRAYWSNYAKISEARDIIQRMIMNDLGLPTGSVTIPGKPLDTSKIPAPARKAMGIEPRITTPEPIESYVPSKAPAEKPAPSGDAKPVDEPVGVIPPQDQKD